MSEQELKQQIAALERALERERSARKSAEDVLRQKAMEVFEVTERLQLSSERLRLSLWASNEVVWEWNARENLFRLYAAITESEVKIQEKGTLEDAISTLHPDYRDLFRETWEAHEKQETENFVLKALRKSSSKKEYRWSLMRGRITKRDASGKAKQFIGLFRDIHNRVLQQQTYQTIVDAFLQSTRPGFIINLKSMHVECNDYCLKMLNLDRTSIKQEQLISQLPVNVVLENIQANNRKFAAEFELADGTKKAGGFYLSEVPDMTINTPYCVVFFSVGPNK
ncbi:PAS domain-containing protein [Glaciecola sp. MH2013]|uniref:PAS domain-containing protein n=1 Tax=Glaciecola sp. MH2013 TaxID=2785524 RepID=UPI00189FF00D|nr:PAS domain-containing protein [Glaciecola sp. MH2013]MBF7074332.1 PAS domain-containing protein [Glaciecola sp. MH2013]